MLIWDFNNNKIFLALHHDIFGNLSDITYLKPLVERFLRHTVWRPRRQVTIEYKLRLFWSEIMAWWGVDDILALPCGFDDLELIGDHLFVIGVQRNLVMILSERTSLRQKHHY
jgi:hypothetical protein